MSMSVKAPEGFTEFVIARGPSLHRTALLLTHNEASAQDLVQVALVKAWRSWSAVHTEREAYVRRILVNEFATGWRRRWRGEHPTAVLPELAWADHSDGVAQHAMLISALAQLPPRQRAVIVLRFFHDYTEARTAETLGIAVGTVKSQSAKALAALRVSDGLGDQIATATSATLINREEVTP